MQRHFIYRYLNNLYQHHVAYLLRKQILTWTAMLKQCLHSKGHDRINPRLHKEMLFKEGMCFCACGEQWGAGNE